DPGVRGARLRDPADLGAVARRGAPVRGRPRLSRGARRRRGARAPVPRARRPLPRRVARRERPPRDPRAAHVRPPCRRAARDSRRAERGRRRVNVAWFGSSLVSSYWNGAATYYRGLVRALHERGHHVTFFEPDAFERQQHRDLADPDSAEVVVYEPARWRDAVRLAAG